MNAITGFLKEAVVELKRVTWPTRKEVINLMIIVVATILIAGAIIGVLDYGLGALVGLIGRA